MQRSMGPQTGGTGGENQQTTNYNRSRFCGTMADHAHHQTVWRKMNFIKVYWRVYKVWMQRMSSSGESKISIDGTQDGYFKMNVRHILVWTRYKDAVFRATMFDETATHPSGVDTGVHGILLEFIDGSSLDEVESDTC
jgi:hypothetical protein